jgi:hypothetical protein
MKEEGVPYSIEYSLYASTSFAKTIGRVRRGRLSDSQLATVRVHIRAAKERNLIARYWERPRRPVGMRNYIWDVLEKRGVGILSIDNLSAARNRYWKTGNNS